MYSRRATYWVVAVLFGLGVVLVGLRLYSRQHVRVMQGDTTWRLTYHISFRAPRAGTRVRIAAPSDDVHSRMFRQDLRFSGLDTDRVHHSRTDTRELRVTTERDGEFRLACRFDIHLSPKRTFRTRDVPAVLDANLGPVVLEANARPGLAIQVANRRGLIPALDLIDSMPPERRCGEARREAIAAVAALPPRLQDNACTFPPGRSY